MELSRLWAISNQLHETNVMNNNQKEIRLFKLIHNEDAVNNLINLYKNLKGKENLEKRLFLKTLVWCSLNPNITEDELWVKPEDYFNSTYYRHSIIRPFTKAKLDEFWFSHPRFYFYNNNTHKVFGKLL